MTATTWGCRRGGCWNSYLCIHARSLFLFLFFFGAVRPLGFVCAQSTLGHKWNVASAPLGKRKKLIVLCSLGGLKNHQAHTYSIKKRRTTWRWRLFCTLKKNGVHDLHDSLACNLHEIVIGTTFLMLIFFSCLLSFFFKLEAFVKTDGSARDWPQSWI